MGWEPYVKTWLATFFKDHEVMPEECRDHLWAIFNATIDVGLKYLRHHFTEPIPTTDLQ